MHNIYYLGLSGEPSLPFGLLVIIIIIIIMSTSLIQIILEISIN